MLEISLQARCARISRICKPNPNFFAIIISKTTVEQTDMARSTRLVMDRQTDMARSTRLVIADMARSTRLVMLKHG